MRKIHILILASLLLASGVRGQMYQWAFGMGSAASLDQGKSVTTDAAGNVYATGHFDGTVDFDPGPGVFNLTAPGADNFYVAKYTAAGALVWAFNSGGNTGNQGNSIAVDASGNVYITGFFGGTVDFDPGAGVANLVAPSMDAFVAKYTTTGAYVWAFDLGATGITQGESISIGGTGNVNVTGNFASTLDFDPGAGVANRTPVGSADIFVASYSPAGTFLFAFGIGGTSSDYGLGITSDATGNVFVTGNFQGTADFDPSPSTANQTSAGSSDIFLAKYNVSGAYQWAFGLGNANSQQGKSVVVDASGNIYITGSFPNTIDFDPGAGVANVVATAGGDDFFVAKYNSNGAYQWAFKVGNPAQDNGYGIALDASANVYVTGNFQQTADFDPGASVANLTSNAASMDVFVAKYSTGGIYQWAFNVGSAGNEVGWGIAVNSVSGNIHVTGGNGGLTDFDPGAGVANVNSAGIYDIFIAKYASCAGVPSTPGSISGQNSICSGAGPTNYSIAAVAGATSYTWSLPGGWSGSSSTNTISATPGTSGIFTITALNTCGASPQQTLAITVNPQPTIAVNSGSVCLGNSFSISPGGANTYTIQGGSAVVSPTSTTIYTVVGTSTAGCVSSSPATSNVTVNPLPTINASSTTSVLCVGQTVTLTASGASTYTFNPGGSGTSISVSPTVTTTYSIVGMSAAGCTNNSTFTQSVSTCASITQLETQSPAFGIFPNPFSSSITIISSLVGSTQKLEIYNSIGENICSVQIASEKTEVDLTGKANGIYFIRIGTVTKKIIKN